MVAKAVPLQDGAIRVYGSGNWYSNTRGFTPFRSAALARPPDAIPGVLVITDASVLFQQWNDASSEFDVVKRMPLSEIMSVSLDTWGVNRRLVIRRIDMSFESFDFTQAKGNFVDAAKVEAAVLLLKNQTSRPAER